ncbi:MAG TPA: acyl-CoA ligase (AMP-forming), exosortase A system-associated [Burkholderiales bacterium]|nr:acyl-CoA ligase (AMP-forming), exosortase A system-associated [Burkholderiales bacterium]
MADLVHHLITESEHRASSRPALKYRNVVLTYNELANAVEAFAHNSVGLSLERGDRVAIYMEKRLETVIAMFGASAAGAVYVPVNPLLKTEQVGYILADCNVRMLVTSTERLAVLGPSLAHCPDLKVIVCVGEIPTDLVIQGIRIISWHSVQEPTSGRTHQCIDQDVAAILYTSGSTGRPKGVVLSHRNIVAGARSVAEYLELTENDRILSVLPLSFDYGMNQLTTMFLVGGLAVLLNHLFPRDIVAAVEKEQITGLAAVPPLWIQLAQLSWPTSATEHLRYFTNSGGHMPRETLNQLRSALPKTKPYLMYGLTEAFRSTYLPPSEVDRRPDSMGKAIPNAEIVVVREDGSTCAPGEPGELVHRGVLVSLGYWNDSEKTAERFKPAPGQNRALPLTELAVWSGDTVKMDEEGYLYFVSRRDEMIKTSGYRVSPTEIEEVIYGTRLVGEVAALGLPHPTLGQAIAIVATPADGTSLTAEALKKECQKHLPAYMVPAHLEIVEASLPRNPNGKIDRKLLATERQHLFTGITK